MQIISVNTAAFFGSFVVCKRCSALQVNSCYGIVIHTGAVDSFIAAYRCVPHFNSAGGNAVAPRQVVAGQKATQPADPTRPNSTNPTQSYVFGGWYTDITYKTPYSFSTAVTGDVTVYALWKVPLWRFFNLQNGEHFYTADPVEQATLIRAYSATWRYEGQAWMAPSATYPGAIPVYRLRDKTGAGTHFYTTDATERYWDLQSGRWIDEGVAFYALPSGNYPIYRLNSSLGHFFTISAVEKQYALTLGTGWYVEGIGFYALSQ